MKKLLFVLAVSVFAACGSGSSTSTTDSTVMVKTDSMTTVAPDTTNKMMDTASKMMDTTKKMESKMSESKMKKDSVK